ncbi:MAG: aldehyde dehydrogenase [Alkalilacustris sp.]
MTHRFLLGGAAAAALTLLAVAAVPQAALDMDNPWYPLPDGDGVMEVYYACNACHSLRTVTNVRYSRAVWDELLDWMVEEQGMPEFRDAEERQLVLDYLATHLSPDAEGAGTPALPAPTSPWN